MKKIFLLTIFILTFLFVVNPASVSAQTCPWSSPIGASTLPGSGAVQAQTEVIYPNNTQLLQAFYRGDQGFWRIVPVVNGNPVWASAGAWSDPISSSTLPGSGTVQTRSDFTIGNGSNLMQAVWRGDQGFWRIVPISGGVPQWGCANSSPTATPILPTSPPWPTCTRHQDGDANCDEKIDGIDYSLWLNRQCTTGCQNENLKADFNHDNKVNDDDYSIWFNKRGTALL